MGTEREKERERPGIVMFNSGPLLRVSDSPKVDVVKFQASLPKFSCNDHPLVNSSTVVSTILPIVSPARATGRIFKSFSFSLFLSISSEVAFKIGLIPKGETRVRKKNTRTRPRAFEKIGHSIPDTVRCSPINIVGGCQPVCSCVTRFFPEPRGLVGEGGWAHHFPESRVFSRAFPRARRGKISLAVPSRARSALKVRAISRKAVKHRNRVAQVATMGK